MSLLIFAITLATYTAAGALYLVELRGAETSSRLARRMLGVAFVCHTIDIGWHCILGTHPFVNAREVLSFTSWLTVGIYLLLTLRFTVNALGVLMAPLAIIMETAARIVPSPRGHASTLLGRLHIGLATASVAVLAVAAGAAVLYLLHEQQLKHHRWGALLRRGASLEVLDQLGRVCVLLGFPLLTLSLFLGALLALHEHEQLAQQLSQPTHVFAIAAWLLLAVLFVARTVMWWRGRRAAWVLLVGFIIVAGVLGSYYLRSLAQQTPLGACPMVGHPRAGER